MNFPNFQQTLKVHLNKEKIEMEHMFKNHLNLLNI
jgi:hypothetical protein